MRTRCGIFYTEFIDGSRDYYTAIIHLNMCVQLSVYAYTTVHTYMWPILLLLQVYNNVHTLAIYSIPPP